MTPLHVDDLGADGLVLTFEWEGTTVEVDVYPDDWRLGSLREGDRVWTFASGGAARPALPVAMVEVLRDAIRPGVEAWLASREAA